METKSKVNLVVARQNREVVGKLTLKEHIR